MSNRIPGVAAAVAIALGLTLPAAIPAAAQTRASASGASDATRQAWTAPRTPWGDPDFQGTWTTDETIGVPIQRPPALGNKLYLTDEDLAEQERQRAARAAAPAAAAGAGNTNPPDHWGESASGPVRQTSFVVEPADGRIPPVTPDAQRRAGARDTGSFGPGPFNRFEDFTNFDRCISRGVVGSMLPRPYGNGLDIVQGPGYVGIRYEMIHEPRIIPLGTRPRLGAAIKQYMGDARGRFEGDTLVVETTNITDQMSIGFNGNGLRHSDQMRLVERFTRVNPTTIEWEVTIDDPKTYTKPFKMSLPIVSRPGYQVFEYACHEGNYGLPNILSAARATERGGIAPAQPAPAASAAPAQTARRRPTPWRPACRRSRIATPSARCSWPTPTRSTPATSRLSSSSGPRTRSSSAVVATTPRGRPRFATCCAGS